jgi:hypothetical protein
MKQVKQQLKTINNKLIKVNKSKNKNRGKALRSRLQSRRGRRRGQGRGSTRARSGMVSNGNTPVIISTKVTTTNATFNGSPVCRMTHREPLGVITSTDSIYSAFKFTVNPGFPVTFPWLSAVAPNFEYYSMNNIAFEWVPSCPTDLGGAVVMALDYDADDTDLLNVSDLENMAGAIRNNIFKPTIFNLSRTSAHGQVKWKYTRIPPTELSPAPLDKKNYDLGVFYIAVLGIPANTTVGELWVRYNINFHTPQKTLIARLPSIFATDQSPSYNHDSPPITLVSLDFTPQVGDLQIDRTDTNTVSFSTNPGHFYILDYMLDAYGTSNGEALPCSVSLIATDGIIGSPVYSYIVDTIATGDPPGHFNAGFQCLLQADYINEHITVQLGLTTGRFRYNFPAADTTAFAILTVRDVDTGGILQSNVPLPTKYDRLIKQQYMLQQKYQHNLAKFFLKYQDVEGHLTSNGVEDDEDSSDSYIKIPKSSLQLTNNKNC